MTEHLEITDDMRAAIDRRFAPVQKSNNGERDGHHG